jgi:hypothetical protein
MKIDPSKLAEPLSHVLGVPRTGAKSGTGKADGRLLEQLPLEDQLEQLDAQLLARMRAAAEADAANSITSMHEARSTAAGVHHASQSDPDAAARAQGRPDAARVRGLLGD